MRLTYKDLVNKLTDLKALSLIPVEENVYIQLQVMIEHPDMTMKRIPISIGMLIMTEWLYSERRKEHCSYGGRRTRYFVFGRHYHRREYMYIY